MAKSGNKKKTQGGKKTKPPADGRSLALARLVAQACHDKKGLHITVLDLRRLVSFTDYFLICSGTSDRHVQAVADHIGETAKKQRRTLYGSEGYARGQWILMDYGDVVAHLFQTEVRNFYNLEGLWRDAPRVRFRLS